MMRAVWIMLMLMGTGCVGGAVLETGPSAIPGVPTEWNYVCEGRPQVAPGVCASSAVDPLAWLGEPAIGAQPGGARVFLAAMAVTAAGAAHTRHTIHVLGFVSEDGGVTWEGVGPIPGVEGFDHIDASVVVDPTGILHYAGLVERVEGSSRVFYASSKDAGRSWSPPVVLSGETRNVVDRNWITQGQSGTLYVSWQESPQDIQVAVSRDGGATWAPVEGLPGCVQASPVMERGPRAYVSCVDRATHVASFETTSGRAAAHVEIAPGCGWSWLADMGPRIALVCETTRLYASEDEGATWVQLPGPERIPEAEAWRGRLLSWAEGNASVGIHLLVREPPPQGIFGAEGLLPIPDAKVAHVVLDANGDLLQATTLTGDALQQRRADGGASMWAKDDFHDIAITPQGIYLAWARGEGIDVALARPVGTEE